MASFTKGGGARTPFGRNEFLRSKENVKTESFTLAASTVPVQTIDGFTPQKIVQPGTVLAKITSGTDTGKVGPFQAGVTDGRQTVANIVGLCQTFIPWQTLVRDVDVAAVQEASVVQGWCFELQADGTAIALTNTTAAAMQRGGAAGKVVDISFH